MPRRPPVRGADGRDARLARTHYARHRLRGQPRLVADDDDCLDIPQDEAAEFIERYLDRFPKVKEYIETTIERATGDCYVTTLFGRKRRIPELRSRKWQTRSLGERLAANTPIQGSSADIIKVAMVNTRNVLRDACQGRSKSGPLAPVEKWTTRCP